MDTCDGDVYAYASFDQDVFIYCRKCQINMKFNPSATVMENLLNFPNHKYLLPGEVDENDRKQ